MSDGIEVVAEPDSVLLLIDAGEGRIRFRITTENAVLLAAALVHATVQAAILPPKGVHLQ